MVKQTPFTALMNSGDLSVDPESLYNDNPKLTLHQRHRLQSLNKSGSLRNLDDTPVSCPHPSVSQEDIRKARFSLSLRDMSYDPTEDNLQSEPVATKSKRGTSTSKGFGGKFKETMSKTVGMALKSSTPAKKSQKGNNNNSNPEDTTSNTTATIKGGGGDLKIVDNGTHLELQTSELSDHSNNTDTTGMEDNSSKHVNARAPGRLRRTGSVRGSNRNATSTEYSRHRSKSKNGRRAKEDSTAATTTPNNNASNATTSNRRSKSHDKAMERTSRDRKLNRSKSERKVRGTTTTQETTQEQTAATEKRNRSKSRDRTVRRTRSNKKLMDHKDNTSNSDLSAADTDNKSKRAHSNPRSKQMHRARSNKKLENSQGSELSLSRHEMSSSEPGRRTRSSSRTRRDKSKGRSSNKKLNSSISDFNNIQQNGHSRSSRLALKRAASLMTSVQHKKNSGESSLPATEHSTGSQKTTNTVEENQGSVRANPPTRGVRRVRSQSSVSARSEASSRSLSSLRSEGDHSATSHSHSHSHREGTITAQPRRRISRPTLRKAMSQSTLWAAKNGAAEVSGHSKDTSHSYSSGGTSDSNTVEAVAEPREDDETLEEGDAPAYPQSPAGTISIDESVGPSPPGLMATNDKDIQADAMAMLKEKININALIPDLENTLKQGKNSPLETLMETARSAGGTSMDEDSTIVSMNSVEKLSAIERAVQEAFEEALQAAVKQHTQSISNTAANHLMQRLRRDGAPVLD